MTVVLASRPVFAKQHGVSKAAVQKWEKRGLIVIVDGKVSVAASDKRLMQLGMGRFSDRARRADQVHVAAHPVPWNGEVKTLPYEARILIAFVNSIAAHGGLTAWEVGAPLEMAQQADRLFRVLMIQAAAELLTDLEQPAPGGRSWTDVPMWSDEHMAAIDWSAVAQTEREGDHVPA